MWWTPDDYYLYEIKFRLPGAKGGPVAMELRRGEDPAKIELEPDLPPGLGGGGQGGEAGGNGGNGGDGGGGAGGAGTAEGAEGAEIGRAHV